MIVRDEEATLERCLRAVEGVADEIVIVDTGSLDHTKAVASRFTPRVLDFAWIDDFAAARNHSFAHATMDYVLWLDADDVVPALDRAKLLDLKRTLDPDIDAVSMIYQTLFDAAGNVVESTRRIRLVKRARHFAWHGVVHEDLVAEGPVRRFDSDIIVTHRKPQAMPGPSRRNLDIYEQHLAAGRTLRPADVFHYARELQMHREFARAIPLYRQFLQSSDVTPDLALFTLHKLATCHFMIGEPDKEWECTLESLGWDIPRPEFACRLAERFMKRDQFRQAIFWYEVALQYPGHGGQEWGVENRAFSTWLPHKQLAECYYRLGDYPRSLHHNRQTRTFRPDDPDVETNIHFLESLCGESGRTHEVRP